MTKLLISGKYKISKTLVVMMCLSTVLVGCDDFSKAASGVLRSLETITDNTATRKDNTTREANTTCEGVDTSLLIDDTVICNSIGERNVNESQVTSREMATVSQKGILGNANIVTNEESEDHEERGSDSPLPSTTAQDSAGGGRDTKKKQPLNLALPVISWDDSDEQIRLQGYLPNIFRQLPSESKLSFSGKIHWDESEAAREMSVEDTIKGAELELQFYLP